MNGIAVNHIEKVTRNTIAGDSDPNLLVTVTHGESFDDPAFEAIIDLFHEPMIRFEVVGGSLSITLRDHGDGEREMLAEALRLIADEIAP